MFGTAAMAPGRYSRGAGRRRRQVLASSPFWVVEPDSQPRIETDREIYARGDPVDVSWSGGPGNKLDYVAIFRAADPSLYSYVGYRYVDARPAGTVRFGVGSPLKPGRYVARLMLDDGYSVIAETPFEVR